MENILDVVGEEILERIQNNEFERDVEGFIPVSGETPSPSFALLRDHWLQRDGLFEDPEFPVETIPMYFTEGPVPIRWLRPGQIVAQPQFINQGPIAGDVRQGSIGNCWALAAASVLAQYGPLFYRVVPPDQGFGQNYAGIFHFHFWRYGRWTEVIIDDRLPCRSNGQLLYSRPPTENVFWAILLEKAYAKMYGGYAKLSGGRVTDCLSDLTGGITQEWDLETLDDAKKRDMELLLVKRPPNSCVKNYSDNCVFGCATGPVNSDLTRAGLVENHAYAIIESRELIVDNRQIIVMLIRNPWGWVNWNGQHSLDWDRLPPANARYMRNKLAENSGGFWLLLDDFVRFFARLYICYLGPHAISEVCEMTERNIERIFDGVMFNGKWTKNGTAGGSLRNGSMSFVKNPQYWIQILANEQNRSEFMVISLLQKYRREESRTKLQIGFSVFRVYESPEFLKAENFPFPSYAETPAFSRVREATHHFQLEAGNYVVIPSTYAKNEEGEFLLRIFTTGTIGMYFRRRMLPKILEAQLPNEYLFFLLRLFSIKINATQKERLAQRTGCIIVTELGTSFLYACSTKGIVIYWPNRQDSDLLIELTSGYGV